MAVERKWRLNAGQAGALHAFLARDCREADLVDDRSWSELEMEKVFARLDRSVTPLGAQYLYSLLRIYRLKAGETAEWAPLHAELKANPKAASDLRAALGEMAREDTANLAGFVFGPPQTVPAHWRLYYLLPAGLILSLGGLLLSHWFLFIAVGIVFINIWVHQHHQQQVNRHGISLVTLGTLLSTVRQLAGRGSVSKLAEVQELRGMNETVTTLHKKVSRLFLRAQAVDDFITIVIEYLNLVLLFETLSCCRALEGMNEARDVLGKALRIIGRLDAWQGLALALPEFPHICSPEIKPGPPFALEEAYHPLLDTPVCNSISGEGRSLLLLGTNMAGKTTFMKTLAVNLLLAQTLGVCLARKAALPPARVRALITRNENTASGQSYFFFEAAELLRMVKNAERDGGEYWFIIDEIFRGTNTVERIAAGTAVLGHLAARWMVVASTHDDELSGLLAHGFDSYHFTEVIAGGEARFDYLLKKGTCPARNAIKLLVMAGYPAEVTHLAERLAASVSNERT